MNKPQNLFLYEELLLLALKDEEGTFEGGFLEHVIAASILAELLLENRIEISSSDKDKVVVVSSKPLGDPIIDECLETMCQEKKPASLKTWIYRFAGLKELRHRIARQLCERGILRADEDKILWIFTRKIYPEVNHMPENQIIERLRNAIFGNQNDVDPRTVVLISLARNAHVLNRPFGKKEIAERKERIDQIVKGDVTGNAANEVIAACQAAMMVATIIPAVTVAAINH